MMRSRVLVGVGLLVLLAGATPALAAQTVEVSMNGRRHVVAFPDGWRASPEDGGVFIQPPAGRDEGLQVVVVGVPTPQNSVSALQMARNVADGDIKKKPYLSATQPDTMMFVGVEGAIVTLDGVDPATSKRETVVYVMAMKGNTTYLLQAAGSHDALVANLEDIRSIVTGVQVLEGAAAAASPAVKNDPTPPSPSEPLWTKDAPLPAPPAGAKFLVNDAMLGVTVDRLEGWGVAESMNAYSIERRLDKKSRVVASIWLGSEGFTGSGQQYKTKVAGDARAKWDRFGQQDALIIERPPEMAGAGDVLEIHVLRGETPIVFSLRFDGGAWRDRAGRELLADLDGATRVGNPGKARGSVAVAGGVAKVKAGKGWVFAGYGPGAAATWNKGPARARVAVFSRSALPPAQCDDQSRPEPTSTRVAGKEASAYSCPKNLAEQLFYTVPLGEHVVYVGFTDTATNQPTRPAAEFTKFLKF
jgi:hypothetical protein